MSLTASQILFGSHRLLTLRENGILRAQAEILNAMTGAFVGIGGKHDPRASALLDQVAAGRGEFRSLKDKGAHSKIYLLDGARGRRVIVGSANLSELAFSGRQAEVMLAFDDSDWMWSEVERDFENLYAIGTADAPLKSEHVHPAEVSDVEVDDFLFKSEIEREETVEVYVPTAPNDDPEEVAQLGAVLEAAENKVKVAGSGVLRPNKGGFVRLTPIKVRGIIRRAGEVTVEEKEGTPNLEYVDGQFIYNGRVLERPVDEDDLEQVGRDADLLTQYFENYSQFEDGSENLQKDYFAFMSWLFFTPFMPRLKKAREDQGPGDFHGKLVALLYGDPNCGKTNVIRLLLTAMFGSPKFYGDEHFTPAQVRARRHAAGLFPLVFDDVGPSRISGGSADGVRIIKEQDRRWKTDEHYPCIVASLNSETYELVGEVRKRSLTVYTDSPLAMDDVKKTDQLTRASQRIHNRIRTAFYREYLYRMDQRLPTEGVELAEVDYLEASSKLIMEMLSEYLPKDESLPDWCNKWVTAQDYDSDYWDKKRDAVEGYLLPELKVATYPPAHGFWTFHRENYVIGVDSLPAPQSEQGVPAPSRGPPPDWW